MPRPILYSTNTYLKSLIQERYFNDVHYVWCSEYFDSRDAPGYNPLVPPSSDPAEIYRRLKSDVIGLDSHSEKITAQKASFTERALECWYSGEINEDQRDEILYMVETASFDYWRPRLYVIPINGLEPERVKLVPIEHRAGFADEYIIEDLQMLEFDIVEF